MTDQELRERLKALDEDENIDVTQWEADFIEMVVYRRSNRGMTYGQRKKAKEILDEYGY